MRLMAWIWSDSLIRQPLATLFGCWILYKLCFLNLETSTTALSCILLYKLWFLADKKFWMASFIDATGKDLHWYTKDKKSYNAEMEAAKEEIKRIKEQEEQAMREALGLAPKRASRPQGNRLDKHELSELVKRGSTAEDLGAGHAEAAHVHGLGFARYVWKNIYIWLGSALMPFFQFDIVFLVFSWCKTNFEIHNGISGLQLFLESVWNIVTWYKYREGCHPFLGSV